MKPLALRQERGPRGGAKAAGRGFLQRLLDLEHLLQQLRRRLRLHRGAFGGLAALLQPEQILDPRDRVAERPVRGVDQRGGLERLRLLLRGRTLMKIRVVLARQRIEPPLQLVRVDGEPPGQPEHFEVVHSALLEIRTGPDAGPVLGFDGDLSTPRTTCHSRSSISPAD